MRKQKNFELIYQERDVLTQQLSGWYNLPVHATGAYDAARKAAKILLRLELVEESLDKIPTSFGQKPVKTGASQSEKYHPAWNARIVNTAKTSESYVIMLNGGFVINPRTGRHNKALEERLSDYIVPPTFQE